MGRAPCCDKASVKRGPWSPEEDITLKNYLEKHGTGGNWIALPQKAGLKRCGKSCRLRWLNYLRPGIKHGGFTEVEDNVICSLYKTIGSKWSVIASHLPGRTDNDVKNYWNTKLKKKLLTAQAKDNPRTATTIATNYNNENHIHHSTSSSPLAAGVAMRPVKSENYVFGSISMSADNSSASTLASVEAGLMFSTHPQSLEPEPASFPAPALSETPTYGCSTNGYVVSPAASSSHATENSSSYVSWPDGGGIDELLVDLGLGPMDFLNSGGYGLLHKVGDVGSIQVADLWSNAPSKPQELYRSVSYS